MRNIYFKEHSDKLMSDVTFCYEPTSPAKIAESYVDLWCDDIFEILVSN